MSEHGKTLIPVSSVPPPDQAEMNGAVDFFESWFSVRIVDGVAHVHITGEVGIVSRPWQDLVADCDGAKDIKLFIDSSGGNTVAAVEIFHALSGRVSETTILNRCFSAALPIALAGKKIRMERQARMLLHVPHTFLYGDEEQMLCAAGRLQKYSAYLKKIIMERTELSETVVAGWLNGADVYFTAEQACAYGLADEIFDAPKLAPCAASVSSATTPGTVQNFPTWTEDEKFIYEMLFCAGRVTVRNRVDFMRELSAWAAYNTDELPKNL
jgi:ATP-dependent protease ClpP protease subunit